MNWSKNWKIANQTLIWTNIRCMFWQLHWSLSFARCQNLWWHSNSTTTFSGRRQSATNRNAYKPFIRISVNYHVPTMIFLNVWSSISRESHSKSLLTEWMPIRWPSFSLHASWGPIKLCRCRTNSVTSANRPCKCWFHPFNLFLIYSLGKLFFNSFLIKLFLL